MRQAKADLVAAIAGEIGVATPHMSTGSTEPREIFELVNDTLGLRLSGTKPELARGIVEASGEAWLAEYESRGGTVTKDGLNAVLRAVRFFLGAGDR